MITIAVKLADLELFPGQPELRAALRQALTRSAGIIKGRAEANLSGRYVAVRTGKLLRGLRVNIRESGQQFVATVKNVVFYGQILESGAKAHRVPGPLTRRERREGRRQKVLRFTVGGKVVFARGVVIPGLRPRRWFSSAVLDAIPDLERIFEQELGAVVSSRAIIAPGVAA